MPLGSRSVNMHEIFDEISTKDNDIDRLNVLEKYKHNNVLKLVLRAAFHPRIEFVIMQIPNYKPSNSPLGMGYTSIDMEMKRIYIFEKNNPRNSPNLTLEKLTVILLQILEALEAKEAVIFSNMLLKNLRIKGLTKELVEKVYPTLLA